MNPRSTYQDIFQFALFFKKKEDIFQLKRTKIIFLLLISYDSFWFYVFYWF